MRRVWNAEETKLILLALAAAILRTAGISWGLPYEYHPDEPTHVNIILNILKTGDWNPHWFLYPSLSLYLGVPVAAAYFLLRVQRGDLVSVQDLIISRGQVAGTGITPVPGLYLGLRLMAALIGVVAILYLYRKAKPFGERVALAAALFLLVSPMHVLTSHWYRADTMVTLFSGVAVLAAVDLYRRNSLSVYLIAGALIGLAASVKYNVLGVLFVPLVLAHLLAGRNLFDWRLWASILLSLAVFALGTPYALLDLPAFLDGFAYEINHYYVRGHPGADWTGGQFGLFLWYVGQLIRFDGPVALLAIAAPLLAEKEQRRETLILASWLLLVLFMNSSTRVYTALALTPVPLVECLLAAISFDRLGRLVTSRWPRLTQAHAHSLLLVAFMVYPTVRTVQSDKIFLMPDVRTTAREWIEENLPPQSLLAVEGYGPTLPTERTLYTWRLIEHDPEWYQLAGYEYLVASNFHGYLKTPDLYPQEVAAYQRLFQFPLRASIEGPMQYHVNPMSEILIFEVPIPERYYLDMAATDLPCLKEGFYDPEDVGGRMLRWTSERAVLTLRLKPDRDYVLTIRGQSGRPAGTTAITRVFLAEELLGEHVWSDSTEEWSVLCPAAARQSGTVDIVLETTPWSPGDSDPRVLGALLESITVVERPG